MDTKITQRSDYTFKYNNRLGRHGWLRLTPAYSVKLVHEIIDQCPEDSFILDPFSGTATTGLVAAEHGMSAHCTDVNPFLIWLGNAKCRNYSSSELQELTDRASDCLKECRASLGDDHWVPDIHNINRWWCGHTLRVLASLRQAIVKTFGEPSSDNVYALAWIAFCRLVIETSSAAFNHVSMSFRDNVTTFKIEQIEQLFQEILNTIITSSIDRIPGQSSVHFVDSRNDFSIDNIRYSHVVTSPPYPNRVSYIRELRPYMYWTKFLDTAREAGELDWKAIGGTWGVATSRLQDWRSHDLDLPILLLDIVAEIMDREEKNASTMAQYVLKYFHDMHLHLGNLRKSLKKGASLSYIVGNSSFYGVQVSTEKILAESMHSLGYSDIGSRIIRKRNSKKELYEFCVDSTWQESRDYVPLFSGSKDEQSEQMRLSD